MASKAENVTLAEVVVDRDDEGTSPTSTVESSGHNRHAWSLSQVSLRLVCRGILDAKSSVWLPRARASAMAVRAASTASLTGWGGVDGQRARDDGSERFGLAGGASD